MKCLCAFEAVNLTNLVEDCEDLSTTRGGGLAVLEIGKVADDLGRIARTESIVRGASKGLIYIEASNPKEAKGLVRLALAKLPVLKHATVMVEACEAPADSKFDEACAKLDAQIRWSQMRSPSVVFPATGGSRVCEIDKVRPTTGKLSEFTEARKAYGRNAKIGLLQRILGDAVSWEFDVVSDLNELADGGHGNAANKIAVLHFDGKGFGDKMRAARKRGPDGLRAFDAAARKKPEDFFRDLVLNGDRSEWWTGDSPPKLRLEIVVYGGDEVVFIVPAWLGWTAMREFFRQAKENGEDRYRAGMVICHAKAPIHAIRKLAGNLSSWAKEHRKGAPGSDAVCQVLESFDAVGRDLTKFMEERYPAVTAEVSAGGAILETEDVNLIADNMSHWRASISKRQLYKLVLALQGDHREKTDGTTIPGLIESSGAPKSVLDSLETLHKRLGRAAFLHVLELWDYVEVEK